MDIRKIAMYLAGKLPPYYGASNLRTFTKKLKLFASEEFTNDEMLFIQQQAKNVDEEVYFMVLDDLRKDATDVQELWKKSKNDIIDLLKDIGVPQEILGIFEENEQYTWEMYEDLLQEKYGKSPTTIQKWDLFEKLCFDILRIEWWFTNVKKASSGADWWIDITAEYILPLGSNTDIKLWFFGQAKYKTSGDVQTKEVNILTTTISNDIAKKYQWVFYFTNKEYAPNAREALDNISYGTSNRKCFWLDGDDILRIVTNNKELFKKYTK